jgi:hypothetical protein
MGVEIAVFVRWVGTGEVLDDLVNEAKGLTWDGWAEHSLVEVQDGRLALIRGLRDGITFRVKGEASDRTLHMDIEGREVRIIRILWHTHPLVTGPSDGDLVALAILGQDDSIIYEIGGEKDGTRIGPKP